jgi:hypothetical protein
MTSGQSDKPHDGRRDITNVCHALSASREQLRVRLELRRSSAASRHKSKKTYDRNDKTWKEETEK